MDLGDLLTTVFGITTLLAAALAGLIWGTVRTLRETASDLRNRLGDVERARAADTEELARLRADNAALGRLKTGADEWRALRTVLDEHHSEAKVHWTKEEALLMAVAEQLTHMEQGRG